VAASSSSGAADAESLFQAFTPSNGRVIAAQRFQIEPDTNMNNTAIYPFGPPVPTLGFTGAMVGGSVAGINGTLKMNFVYREFDADLRLPGTWQAGQITETAIAADGDFNSGNMPLTPSAGSFIQWGLAITASNARADLDLTLAVKY